MSPRFRRRHFLSNIFSCLDIPPFFRLRLYTCCQKKELFALDCAISLSPFLCQMSDVRFQLSFSSVPFRHRFLHYFIFTDISFSPAFAMLRCPHFEGFSFIIERYF